MIKLHKFLIIECALLLCAFAWLFCCLYSWGFNPKFLNEHCGFNLMSMPIFVAWIVVGVVVFVGAIIMFTAVFALLDPGYWHKKK